MNKVRQQAILLFGVMGFLSAVTVFFVAASGDTSRDSTAANNSSMNITILENVEVSEPEGDGLIDQAIKGLIALNRDFNTGISIVSDESSSAD